MSYSLGVDLGTTFLAAAVARPTGARMVTLGEQTVVVPALVDVTDDGVLVTGVAAQRPAAGRADRPLRALKRRLGDPTPVRLGGEAYPVTTLLGAQLRDVVARVSDIEGGRPERVVLTHPASWDRYRRDQFGEVARAAGIETPQLVTEAEAAVASALADRLHDGEIVAVYDLGGGTLEATVVRKHADGLEVLGADGLYGLGGIDLDDAILAHVDRTTGGALSGLDADDPAAAAALTRLRQACVLAKEALSRDTETVVPVLLPGWHCEVRLTRWALEEMVRPAVASTMTALSGAVRASGLISSDLGAVVLMGGSSRIPLVREMLSQEFGRPTLEGVHPKYPVALGAATTARARLPAAPVTASVTAQAVTAGSVAAESVAAESVAAARGGSGAPAPEDERRAPGPAEEPVAGSAPAPDGAGPEPARNGAAPEEVRNGTRPDGARNGAAVDGAHNRFDPPTQMLVIPRHELPPPLVPDPALLEGADPGSRPRGGLGRGTFTVLAAAAAVLVLALVYFLAPGPAPVPAAVPAGAPVTSAPAATSTAPPSAATTTSAAPTRSSTRSSTARRSSGSGQRTKAATTTSRPRRSGA